MLVTRIFALVALGALCAATASATSAPSGHIVFASASGGDGKAPVWVMDANGTGRHAISPRDGVRGRPLLSRDGRRIAFVRRDDIYVMSVNGATCGG